MKDHQNIKLSHSTRLKTLGFIVNSRFLKTHTVKPLLSSPLLSGHPLLNGLSSNSQNCPRIDCKLGLRMRSPFRIHNWLILLYFTSVKRSHSHLQCNILEYFYTMIHKPCPLSFNSSSNNTSYTVVENGGNIYTCYSSIFAIFYTKFWET